MSLVTRSVGGSIATFVCALTMCTILFTADALPAAGASLPASAAQTFHDLKLNVWGCTKRTLKASNNPTAVTMLGRTLKPNAAWTEWACSISTKPEEVATRSNIAHRWIVDMDTEGTVYIEYYRFSLWPNGDLNIDDSSGIYGSGHQCKTGKLVLTGSIPKVRGEFVSASDFDLITCSNDYGRL